MIKSREPRNRLDRLNQYLQPAQTTLWILFVVWTAVGFFVMPMEPSDAFVRRHVQIEELRIALQHLVYYADAAWLILAAMVTYLAVSASEGMRASRTSTLLILTGSLVIEWIGVKTGFPFGPYGYTDKLGPKILGVVPMAIPFAWLAVVQGGRYLIERLLPGAARWKIALGAGLAALLTDLNLEFVAWKLRGYWVWYPYGTPLAFNPPAWPPVWNYLSWFVFAALLAFACHRPFPEGRKISMRPVWVLALMNALFLAAHAGRLFRS